MLSGWLASPHVLTPDLDTIDALTGDRDALWTRLQATFHPTTAVPETGAHAAVIRDLDTLGSSRDRRDPVSRAKQAFRRDLGALAALGRERRQGRELNTFGRW
jgi:hypothetical protein